MRSHSSSHDLVYICDWLPPDFGAVGQYSALFAREMAAEGKRIALIGLSSGLPERTEEAIGRGRLTVIKMHADRYDKTRSAERLLWTLKINTRLLIAAWPLLRRTKSILFTGSPPLFLHWIAPANLLLRKELVYRITDFHPECAIAERGRASLLLRLVYWATLFWRRRVDRFEVLGHDQAVRLGEIGIPENRIVFKPDPSPVEIPVDTPALERPPSTHGKLLLLYSGNWGVAHDTATFVDGYTRHHREGSGVVVLWLNAVGAGADRVEGLLKGAGLPLVRGAPVPIEELARLLVTPEAHLITLSDPFVGYVLPSKVHACIQSGKPILFIGSERSDVHRLCSENARGGYHRVEAGDGDACAMVLEKLASSFKASVDAR